MPCTPIVIDTPDGKKVTGFVCTRGARRPAKCDEPGCNEPHTALCDFELAGRRRGKTCDRKMCHRHRHEQPEKNADGGRRDFCGAHAAHAAVARAAATGATIALPAHAGAPGDPFVDAVKRGSEKLTRGDALPWWSLVTAAAAMRASSEWTEVPVAIPPDPVAGEIAGR